MSLPVSLDAVADELEGLSEQSTAYINRESGELITLSDEDLALVEDEELDEEELPDWQAEMLPKLREVVETDHWVTLPTKFDIHEWEIMRDFAQSAAGPAGDELERAIHGSGAFRMFRATVERLDLREQWFAFRRRAFREIAREALEDLSIPFK